MERRKEVPRLRFDRRVKTQCEGTERLLVASLAFRYTLSGDEHLKSGPGYRAALYCPLWNPLPL